MLRITITRAEDPTTVRLEGRLAGPWVEELRAWWEAVGAARGRGAVRVDLSEVAFVDAEGRALLERMYRRGAELAACGCMTRAICDEIVAAAARPDPSRPPDVRSGGRAG